MTLELPYTEPLALTANPELATVMKVVKGHGTHLCVQPARA